MGLGTRLPGIYAVLDLKLYCFYTCAFASARAGYGFASTGAKNRGGETEIDVTKLAQVEQTTIGTPQHKLLTATHTCTDDLLPVSDTFLENYLSENVAKGTKYTLPVELV